MTQEIENGIENGVGEQVGGNGGEQAKGVENSAKDSNVDEIARLKAELAKKDSKLSEFAEEKKKQAEELEAKRLAELSTEEQLKEMKAKLDAQEEERAFNNAFASNGLNASEYRQALDMFKNKDFNGLAAFMAGVQTKVTEQVRQQTEEQVKSSIVTSSAPSIKDTNSTEDALKSMGLL